MRSPSRAAGAARRRPVRAVAVCAAIGLSAVTAACGSDGDDNAEAGAPAGAGAMRHVLSIQDFTFSPEPLTVPKGTVVEVVNRDDAAHTATADDGSFDTGDLDKGASKGITLSKSGEITYHCAIHDYMEGVIRVTD